MSYFSLAQSRPAAEQIPKKPAPGRKSQQQKQSHNGLSGVEPAKVEPMEKGLKIKEMARRKSNLKDLNEAHNIEKRFKNTYGDELKAFLLFVKITLAPVAFIWL
ncbi:hypothetical protein ATANTOWER_016243 [Ataeniobius toweri]|uniref:Uncharacterized protein n=1 Tax=Ataeniobius toweri TaxID=208326 RepID=A0ABU7A6M6_9TELE|nr:hypothetical protein [Ataeniobius toweri]